MFPNICFLFLPQVLRHSHDQMSFTNVICASVAQAFIMIYGILFDIPHNVGFWKEVRPHLIRTKTGIHFVLNFSCKSQTIFVFVLTIMKRILSLSLLLEDFKFTPTRLDIGIWWTRFREIIWFWKSITDTHSLKSCFTIWLIDF